LRNEVVARFEKVFLKGRKPDQLSSAEKKVLGALSQATGDVPEDLDCGISCAFGGVAFAIGKRLCICPFVEKYSDEFIIYLLGHEIGHVADICAFDNTGLAPGEHPFETAAPGGSVLNCLKQNGISAGSSDESEKALKEVGKGDSWWDWATGKGDKKEWTDHTRKHVHCFGGKTSSRMREASADIMGFEILSDYLKDHPLKPHPQNFKRLFGMFWEDGCRYSSARDKKLQGNLGHPPHIDRLTKIAMSLPAIRQALNCSDHTNNLNCEYQPATNKPAANSPNTVK
jgi:hypothetical protein